METFRYIQKTSNVAEDFLNLYDVVWFFRCIAAEVYHSTAMETFLTFTA